MAGDTTRYRAIKNSYELLFGEGWNERKALVFVIPSLSVRSNPPTIHYRVGYADDATRTTRASPYRHIDNMYFDPTYPDRVLVSIPLREVIADRVRATFVEFVSENTPHFYVKRSGERFNPYAPDEKMYTEWRVEKTCEPDIEHVLTSSAQSDVFSTDSADDRNLDSIQAQTINFISTVLNASVTDQVTSPSGHSASALENLQVDVAESRVERKQHIESSKALWQPPLNDAFAIPIWVDERHWRLCNDNYTSVATAENAPPLDALPRIIGAIRSLFHALSEHFSDFENWDERFGDWPDPGTWPAVTITPFWHEIMAGLDRIIKRDFHAVIIQTAMCAIFHQEAELKITTTAHCVDVNDAGCVVSFTNAYEFRNAPGIIDVWRLNAFAKLFDLGAHPFSLYTSIHNELSNGNGMVSKSSYLIAKRYDETAPGGIGKVRVVGGYEWYNDGTNSGWGEKSYNGQYIGQFNSKLELLSETQLLETGAVVRSHLQSNLANALDVALDLCETYVHLDINGTFFISHPTLPFGTCLASRAHYLTVDEMRTIHRLRTDVQRWRGECMFRDDGQFEP